MDELLKAITNLINTGGDLANDALYLYFALQIVKAASLGFVLTAPAWIICRTILRYQENEKK